MEQVLQNTSDLPDSTMLKVDSRLHSIQEFQRVDHLGAWEVLLCLSNLAVLPKEHGNYFFLVQEGQKGVLVPLFLIQMRETS